ncbi:MAG: FMN-binding protein [Acidobacteria bacterium]|nr:FMN-binding protein [Acidobacteriota bacterium]
MTSDWKRVVPILLGLFLLVFQAELQPSISAAYSLVSQFIPLSSEAEQRHIREVLPDADAFSSKEGDPPYYKGYKIDPQTNRRTVVGLAFFTIDASPRERGYEGPINIAVGINMQGVITQIKVVAHREPYGYFSVDRAKFAEQFRGKSLRDRFRMGRDIDAVTRATMSIGSASRSIRKGARQIFKQYLEEEENRE